MNEDELRALIRGAIQRHLGSAAPESASARSIPGELRRDAGGQQVSIAFGQYQLERAAGDNMCLIEPAVRCNHCGFCKCHGH
jgi:hypothetical protein